MAGNKRRSSPSIPKSKLPKPFDWNDDLITSVQKRMFGHAQSGALLARCIVTMFDRRISMTFLYHLSQLGFYGDAIWYGFENYCRSDMDMFIAVVETEDKDFAKFVLDYKAQEALRALRGKDV